MSPRASPRPPSKARSRETLRRLLDAAEVVLVRDGFEGATLARIAKQARVSQANVYRRFRDKEALMRAVFRRFTDRSSAAAAAEFDLEAVRPLGLVNFSRRVIAGMVDGFRANAGLSRVAVQFSEQHWELDFVRRGRRSEAKSFDRMVQAFLLWRDQIRHPDPEYAIRFGFAMMALLLRELILFGRTRTFADVVAIDDERLKRELPRLFLAYLGVEDPA